MTVLWIIFLTSIMKVDVSCDKIVRNVNVVAFTSLLVYEAL